LPRCWDETFEGFVAEIAGSFIKNYDARRERCFIAEREDTVVGAVFLVRGPDNDTAKLRLLYVEPTARGFGIGARLVEECRLFAHSAGYARIVLWTNSILAGARHIYEAAGYRFVKSEPHRSFGHDLVGETWELDLRAEVGSSGAKTQPTPRRRHAPPPAAPPRAHGWRS
jgi:GNAT superfamily N-acetyltransferase